MVSVAKLKGDLFNNRNYDKYSFPVKDHNKAVNVSLRWTIIKITDLVSMDF